MLRYFFAAIFACQCGAISISTGGEVGHALELKTQNYEHVRTLEGKKDDKPRNPLGGVILGFVIWCFVPCAIWNNERIAIKQYKMQLHAERWAIQVEDVDKEPIPDMNGRVVYMQGKSECSEELSDEIFKGVKSTGKIKLRRIVEMYQWVETEHEDDDGRKTYSYSKSWLDYNSSVRHDTKKAEQNGSMPFSSTKRQDGGYRVAASLCAGMGSKCAEAEHKNVTVGKYYLGEYVIRELNNWQPKKDVDRQDVKPTGAGLTAEKSGKFEGEVEEVEGNFYWGGRRHDIGDVRVRFEELCTGPLTLCGVLAKTETGWTFVPIIRTESAAEGASAEMGGACSCCLRVKELHYDEDTDEKQFKEELENRPIELTRQEAKGFKKAKTAVDFKEYEPGEDLEDLCCVGPFGSCLIAVLHSLGLEEEFLGVHESNVSLGKLMDKEGSDAANRHHTCRGVSCLLLVAASLMILKPIFMVLNAHWLLTLFGGGLISVILCCAAVCCSFMVCMCVMSTAWLYYRPFLAIVGFAIVGLCAFACYYYYQEAEKNQQSQAGPSYAALFLQVRRAAKSL